MTKLEQMQESLRAKFQKFHEEVEVPMSIKAQGFKEFKEYVKKKEIEFLNSLITEVWNEAVKECESEILSLERWESTDGGEAGMRAEDYGGYINREQTLQAISKLRV